MFCATPKRIITASKSSSVWWMACHVTLHKTQTFATCFKQSDCNWLNQHIDVQDLLIEWKPCKWMYLAKWFETFNIKVPSANSVNVWKQINSIIRNKYEALKDLFFRRFSAKCSCWDEHWFQCKLCKYVIDHQKCAFEKSVLLQACPSTMRKEVVERYLATLEDDDTTRDIKKNAAIFTKEYRWDDDYFHIVFMNLHCSLVHVIPMKNSCNISSKYMSYLIITLMLLHVHHSVSALCQILNYLFKG